MHQCLSTQVTKLLQVKCYSRADLPEAEDYLIGPFWPARLAQKVETKALTVAANAQLYVSSEGHPPA